jgi:hypothetical protein
MKWRFFEMSDFDAETQKNIETFEKKVAEGGDKLC